MAIRYSGIPSLQYLTGQNMIISIDGLSTAYNKLMKIADKVEVEKDKLIENLVFDGVVIAKEEVPVDTGELRDSIHGEITDKGGSIIAETDHCIFVEFGTGIRGRNTSPIGGDNVDYIYDIHKREWKGNKANPFMHRTAVRLMDDIRTRGEEFLKAVTK